MASIKPWEINPDLTEERLCFIAKKFAQIRHDALLDYDEDKGDSNWSFGCRVYDRNRNILIRLAEEHSWLKIIDPSLRFIFQIGWTPVRYYKGDADQPKLRSLNSLESEIKVQLDLGLDIPDVDWAWRFVTEVDINNQVFRVVLQQVNKAGDIRNPWEIPLHAPVTIVTPVGTAVQDGVDLEPPVIGIPTAPDRKRANE